jgi:hypothetical protein
MDLEGSKRDKERVIFYGSSAWWVKKWDLKGVTKYYII